MLSTILLLLPLIYSVPYKNGDVGVQIELPTESAISATSQLPPFCMISSSNSGAIWHLRLDRSANPSELNPKDYVHFIRSRRVDPEGTKVLADSALTIRGNWENQGIPGVRGVRGEALAAGQKLPSTVEIAGWWLVVQESEGVFGWLAIPTFGRQMLVAGIFTSKDVWDTHGGMLVEALESLQLLDPVALITEKINGLDAASVIISTLNKQTVRPLVGFHEWRRIQSIDENGVVQDEIGYLQVSVTAGNNKELNDVREESPTPPNGIIVTLRSRILIHPETGVVVDTVGKYWMSWDGKDERWSNKITRWLDRAKTVKSETGLRNRAALGSAQPTILVMQQESNSIVTEEPFKAATQEPWLPRALIWVMGPLLKNADSQRFVWYCYDNPGKPKITTRTDVLTKNSDGTKTITTTFDSAGDTLRTIVDHDGRLVQQVQQGSFLITGSSKDVLQRIWQPKNLW